MVKGQNTVAAPRPNSCVITVDFNRFSLHHYHTIPPEQFGTNASGWNRWEQSH